mgnify:CR=1 FL=1
MEWVAALLFVTVVLVLLAGVLGAGPAMYLFIVAGTAIGAWVSGRALVDGRGGGIAHRTRFREKTAGSPLIFHSSRASPSAVPGSMRSAWHSRRMRSPWRSISRAAVRSPTPGTPGMSSVQW